MMMIRYSRLSLSLKPVLSGKTIPTYCKRRAVGVFSTQTSQLLNEIVNSEESVTKSTPESFRREHQIRLWSNLGSKEDYPPIMSFDSAPFCKELLDVLEAEGFVSPTPTQAQSWPIALEKRDMISVARTGSGKTCGFLLPAFEQLMTTRAVSNVDEVSYSKHKQSPKVLVLAPTRELAVQIESEAQKYSQACGLATTCLYGGVPKKNQILRLQAGIDVAIATPGRCIDLFDGGNLDLSCVTYLVLDEADRMLDMGFEPQIRQILSKIPAHRQSLFFSATWPFEVQALADEFLRDPIQINIGDRDVLNANKAIDQHIMVMKDHEKTDKLIELFEVLKETPESPPELLPKTIVFVARRSDCDSLVRLLNRLGYPTESLHGDRTQDMRDRAMEGFRDGKLRVLVATDVASRGLDVKDIKVVVNYDFPLGASGVESYVHRIGRTARGHSKGSAYTFFTQRDGRAATELCALLVRCRQTTPLALKEIAREGQKGNMEGDSRRGSNTSAIVSKPFKPLKTPAVKKAPAKGKEKSCKGQNIGRRDNGQYESCSPSSRGGGARRVSTELKTQRVKPKQEQDYGDY